MKLWLISQTKNDNYDTYDSAVVAAETEEAARNIHPSGDQRSWGKSNYDWCDLEYVQVKYLGVAKEGQESGVICDSFNAG